MKNNLEMIKNHEKVLLIRRFQNELFFVLGFIFDLFTLGRIDDSLNLISQFIYLMFSSFIVIYLYTDLSLNFLKKVDPYLNEALHFFLGSLLSAYSIFYFKSSSLANSLIFMCAIISFLFINETSMAKERGVSFKSFLLALCTISFFNYLFPVIFGTTGFFIFLFSSLTCAVIGFLLQRIIDKIEKQNLGLKGQFFKAWSLLIVIFNIFYFLRIIPPVPLAIKEIGIFYNIEKENGSYKLTQEDSFFSALKFGESSYVATEGNKIYIFLRIFAPSNFKETVYTHWQTKINGEWATSDRIPLNIIGGRDEGFRGFAYKSNYQEGQWRVLAETTDGLEIGRTYFSIEKAPQEQEKQWRYIIR